VLQYTPGALLPAQTTPPPSLDQRLGPRDILSFCARYSGPICASIITSLLIGTLYIYLTPPSFTAYSQISIESRRGTWAPSPEASYAQYTIDNSQIENQIQLIKSAQLADIVVRQLELDTDPDLRDSGFSFLSNLKALLLSGQETAPKGSSGTGRLLAQRVQARRIGQSYVIEISFTSANPEKAARICNSVTAAYIADLLQSKINGATGGGEILERRIDTLQAQREAAEQVVRSGAFGAAVFPAADARVITTAFPPRQQSWPRPSLVLAFAGLAGLFLALLAAAVHRSMDLSLRGRDQVSRELGLDLLCTAPKVRTWPGGTLLAEAVGHPLSLFTREIVQAATVLRLRHEASSGLCIGITSTTRGEGKLTIAVNLASAMASGRGGALLIDANLVDGQLTSLLDVPPGNGLLECIVGKQPIEHVLIRGAWPMVDVLPSFATCSPATAVELLRSPAMQKVLETLRPFYSAVIVVLSAVEDSAETKAIAAHLDGVVMVTEYGRVGTDRIARGIRGLQQANVKLLGAILNKCPS
jgi:succinoglycan biosynthesis transport protein ExoP